MLEEVKTGGAALYISVKSSRNYRPHDPAIPPLGICTKNTTSYPDLWLAMFDAVPFTISRKWKQPNVLQLVNI